MRYESFVIQESFNPATNSTDWRKRLQNFHESTTQRHKGESGSVALAVKRDFMKGPKKGNCCVCGIPGRSAKDCRWKENALCSKCGEKGHHTGHARDKEMEANMSQWQWFQHWLHQTGNTGQLLPSGGQQACWWTVVV